MPPSGRPDEHADDHADDHPELLDADDVGEEVPANDDEGDVAMDSDTEEFIIQNDSIAFFDGHADSIFTIAQHPVYPSLIATGGSEGEADDAPGKGYVLDISAAPERPVLPSSYSGAGPTKSTELEALFAIEGHTDSINALTFTLPRGEFLVSTGLDGRMRTYTVTLPAQQQSQPPNQNQPAAAATLSFLAEAQEVPEINWVAPCPSPDYPNTVALGASDNSVWIYTIDPAADPENPLQVVNTYWLHMAPCTAGAWTPDGSLLATVAEDSSLYVWDVWGLGAAAGVVDSNGQSVVSLTAEDQRFVVDGGLYSVAVDPTGALVAVGGADGHIRIVSLPRVGGAASAGGKKAAAAKGGKGAASSSSSTAGGQILASLKTQSESIETLAFVRPSGGGPSQQATTLLAAGSVDGSIVVYDATRRFAVRRNIAGAHEEHSVVRVEFVPGTWLLTSCGMDGVVRRWDLRAGASTVAPARQNPAAGGAAAPPAPPSLSDLGLVKEWKGHRGDGEGGGVLGFVQGSTGERVATAGDDGVVLVFDA